MIESIVVLLLSLGILPSFTALTHTRFSYLGPLNFIKAGLPFLAYFIWLKRKSIPKHLVQILIGTLTVFTVSTLVAGLKCHFPPLFIREWAVLVTGTLAALCFFLLGPKEKYKVLAFWTFIIYGSAVLEAISPAAVDWLFQTFFDPQTLLNDYEINRRALGGIFGRQSMGKILAWTPWILLLVQLRRKETKSLFDKESLALLFFGMISTGIILGTTQRGPFVGACFAWLLFGLHLGIQLKNRKAALIGVAAMVVVPIAMVCLVPNNILETRFRTLVGLPVDTPYGVFANRTRSFRTQMHKFSLEKIAKNPLGIPCISDQEFKDAGFFLPAHSHQMFLHQFRERGWIWGFTHLVLWAIAFLGAWKSRSMAGSALVAGIASVCIPGLVDNPWFVINHAMMVSLLLIEGIALSTLKPIHFRRFLPNRKS